MRKKFIIILSILICIIIGCTTWNIVLNNILRTVDAVVIDGTQNDQDNTPTAQPNTSSVQSDVTSTTELQTQLPSNAAQTSVNPLNFSKAQIVNYYNNALKKTYSQPKFTDVRHEDVTIGVDSITINGKPAADLITNTANSIASKNQRDINETRTFINGKPNQSIDRKYQIPSNLNANGAKSATISKNGSGYKVVIVLVPESCGYNGRPKYNDQCAWPLDIADVASGLNGFAEITQATFSYPATTLTSTIDANGRVTSLRIDMPLTVTNGTGVVTFSFPGVKGMTIVSSAHGKWTCTHNMTF